MQMVSTTQIIGHSPASAEPGAGSATPDPTGAELGAPSEDVGHAPAPTRPALDPTRFGDWEKNGRCIDF